MPIDSMDISFHMPGGQPAPKVKTVNQSKYQKDKVLQRKKEVPVNDKQKKHTKRPR